MMYEHIAILKGDLNKEEIEEEIKKYNKYFQEHKISVENFENKGLQDLVYETRNYKEGIYLFYKIWTEEDKIHNLESFARANDNVLKFLSVSLKEKRIEESDIIEKINVSNESFLFKGVADYVVTHLENLNEDGRNIDFNIDDVQEITENVLNDDYFYNNFINTISDYIDEKFPEQEHKKESEEEM